METVSDDPIVMDSALVAARLAESTTCTVKLKGLPVAVLGVPVMAPVEVFNVSPPGSAPVTTDHV